MVKTPRTSRYLLAALFAFSVVACGPDDRDTTTVPASCATTVLRGVISDNAFRPIPQASVALDDYPASWDTTGEDGTFEVSVHDCRSGSGEISRTVEVTGSTVVTTSRIIQYPENSGVFDIGYLKVPILASDVTGPRALRASWGFTSEKDRVRVSVFVLFTEPVWFPVGGEIEVTYGYAGYSESYFALRTPTFKGNVAEVVMHDSDVRRVTSVSMPEGITDRAGNPWSGEPLVIPKEVSGSLE